MPQWASKRDVATLAKKLSTSGVLREDWWRPGEGRHEVTFALELATARLLMYDDGREGADAWKRAFPADRWLTGTIDWLGDDWIDDLKTGRWPVVASESLQMRSYLLVPWLLSGAPQDWTGLATITQWPKYPLAGQPKRNMAMFSGEDMADHLERLRYAVAHPTEENVTDEGCRFCPSKLHCTSYKENNGN